jgi:signal peptidase I
LGEWNEKLTVVATPSHHEHFERQIFIRAALAGFCLFAVAFTVLPSRFGPLFRLLWLPATSMAPSLNEGQFIVVSHLSYGYGRYSFDFIELPLTGRWPSSRLPKRGDIAVFRLPRDHETLYIKRIAGLPGDRIQMIKGMLWINEAAVPREPAGTMADPAGSKRKFTAYTERFPGSASHMILQLGEGDEIGDNTALFTVPPGHYFMIGDNRNNSVDSRIGAENNGVGFVPLQLIIGAVVASF